MMHPAGRALDIHDFDALPVHSGDIQAAIGFHQHSISMGEKILDQIGSFILKEGLPSGDFNQ